jgi:hypothetical protein
LANPVFGQQQISAQLNLKGIRFCPTSVHNVSVKNELETLTSSCSD